MCKSVKAVALGAFLLGCFGAGLLAQNVANIGTAPARCSPTANCTITGTWTFSTPPVGAGSPGGSTTQVQYNNAGAFGGDAGLTYNAATDRIISAATGSWAILTSDPSFELLINRASLFGIEGWRLENTLNNEEVLSADNRLHIASLKGMTIRTGASGATSTANFELTTNYSGQQAAGYIDFTVGARTGVGEGGFISLTTGTASGADQDGGPLFINLGAATGTGIKPYVRILGPSAAASLIFAEPSATSMAIRPSTTTGHAYLLQAYDTDTGPGYVTFGTFTNGTAPSFVIAPPAGGGTVSVTGSYATAGSGLTVANVGANSCGTSAATVAGNANAFEVTVGATSGTECRVTFPVAAATRRDCVVTNETTANLARTQYISTTQSDLEGTFVGGDVLSVVCFTR